MILIIQTYDQKLLQSPGTIVYFWNLEKMKKQTKQSEIEVKMIIKIKKHNLYSNWQIVCEQYW